MVNSVEIIRAALERLDGGKHWCTGELFTYAYDGKDEYVESYCMIGSMIGTPRIDLDAHLKEIAPALNVIAETIKAMWPSNAVYLTDIRHTRNCNGNNPVCVACAATTLTISSFNDARNRTWEDVEAVLQKALLKAEEVF